jgi:hypothetical protein
MNHMTSTQPQLYTVVVHGRPVCVSMLSPPEYGLADSQVLADMERECSPKGSIGSYLRQVEDRRHPGQPVWDGDPQTVTVRPANEREATRWQHEYDDAVTKDEYYGEGWLVWLVPLREPSDAGA